MRDRRSHFVLLGLIVLALVGVALLVVPGSPAHRKATLGLDQLASVLSIHLTLTACVPSVSVVVSNANDVKGGPPT